MCLLKLIFTRCHHKNTRIIYGDEILNTIRAFRKPMIARIRCVDCGKALYDVDMTDQPNYDIAS